jgi:calcineurin-like phosphoesterase family protein
VKHWTTWFTSDIHFGHDNVIDFCNRPFANKEEMKDKIIENFNRVVKPDDLLVFVGDIFFYHTKQQMQETLDRVNGRKILIRGNHDQKPRQMMNAGFHNSVEEAVMLIGGERVLLSHYPFAMPEWKFQYRRYMNRVKKKMGIKRTKWPEKYHDRRPRDNGQFLIHGHTHSKYKCVGRQIHVGVDAWDYKPVNIQDISNLIHRIKEEEKRGRKLIITAD